MTRAITVGFVILLLLFTLAFSVQNARPIMIDFFVDSIQLPLSVVVISSLIIGFLLGLIGMMNTLLKLKFENARLKKDARARSKESNSTKSSSSDDE